VLAFTTIGPIVLVYRVYAKWSRKINHEIWAALGDASDVATQAIGNIRTVRAFGMEPGEERKYQEATGEALDRGIKDAYAGAGTFALTNYIDLGISVLLLWYGGSVVMAKDGRLTVGNMITFQLYWYEASYEVQKF
jgi:ABC-type multidrug transport system fused ATPase/permease subunit